MTDRTPDALLAAYGYRPGPYAGTCADCKGHIHDAGKRFSRCRPCAVAERNKVLRFDEK